MPLIDVHLCRRTDCFTTDSKFRCCSFSFTVVTVPLILILLNFNGYTSKV